MLKTFKISFKLKMAYKVNGIIFWLKKLPIIKKLLPTSVYASRDLKLFAGVIGIILELLTIFLYKGLYLLIIYLSALGMSAPESDSFVHILLFFTIIGGFINTEMFNPTKDKFYAICMMRINVSKYVISNYLYFLMKMFIGFLTFSLIFGMLSGLGILTCLAVPVLLVSVKLSYSAISLVIYRKKQKIKNDNKPTLLLWIGVVVLLAMAILPPYLGYAINEVVFCILTILMIIPAIYSYKYIHEFDDYNRIYKNLLKPENFMIRSSKEFTSKATMLAMKKKITMDPSQTSNKTGYKYFNDLFMKRHSKLLTKSAKFITLLAFAAFIVAVFACKIYSESSKGINIVLHTSLPYFLFVMYWVNRGNVITQAMFMNCDHSMLSYRFYRQPKAILLLFVERLKYIIIINLMPATVIGLGLSCLLYITGGTDNPINYVLLFISILAMSVFFSVHTIVLYYLFQPYNINLELKSLQYNIANFVTYFICYFAMDIKIPTLIFGTAITVFCIIYAIVAFILAYKLAPKTFRIKQ